jgi:hypothetical protein
VSHLRVVVDGSNLATEGRTVPSLVQLDEAVRAFMAENPKAEIIVVVDASFEHRVAPSERQRFKDAELAGEIVTPPAGAVGRGDAFILKIAARVDGVVLSNDSFQEFHDQHQWLFEPGRLIGGKPIKGVGWIFTDRLPVRGAKSQRVTRLAKKLAVALPEGVTPKVGDTLTPRKATRVTKKAVKVAALDEGVSTPPEPTVAKPAKAVKKTSKATKAVKKVAKALAPATPVEPDAPVKKAVAKKAVAKKSVAKKAPAKKAATPVVAPTPEPPVALRRGRQPVNPDDSFAAFLKQFKVGATLEGEVAYFTSHGAAIKVQIKGGDTIECYAPTTGLGSPAPARARDVVKRGERRTFVLINVDTERRIAELGLS